MELSGLLFGSVHLPPQLFHLTSGHLVTAIPVIFSVSPWFYVSLCLSRDKRVCMKESMSHREKEGELTSLVSNYQLFTS